MIVECEGCNKKYQLNVENMKADEIKRSCQSCGHMMTIRNPNATASIDNSQDNSETTGATETAQQHTDTGNTRKGAGLITKVILLMLLVSLVPGAIFFSLLFKETNSSMITDITRSGEQVSQVLSEEIDEWIDKNVRVLSTLAELDDMKTMDRYKQEDILKVLRQEYPWVYLAFTTDTRGFNVARNDGKALKDYSDRQYVKDVINGKSLAWQNLIGKTSKKPALVLAVPISRDGENIGVLAAAMTRDAISKRITNFKQGETGFIFLVDQTGKVVAHQNPELVQYQADMSDHPLITAARTEKAGLIEFSSQENEEYIGFAKQTKLGWSLALQQNKEEAFELLQKLRSTALTLLCIIGVVIVLIAYFASRSIVKPIKELTSAANRISVGDLGVEIKTKTSDEIGDLADAIMRMQDSINLSIKRLKRRR